MLDGMSSKERGGAGQKWPIVCICVRVRGGWNKAVFSRTTPCLDAVLLKLFHGNQGGDVISTQNVDKIYAGRVGTCWVSQQQRCLCPWDRMTGRRRL